MCKILSYIDSRIGEDVFCKEQKSEEFWYESAAKEDGDMLLAPATISLAGPVSPGIFAYWSVKGPVDYYRI